MQQHAPSNDAQLKLGLERRLSGGVPDTAVLVFNCWAALNLVKVTLVPMSKDTPRHASMVPTGTGSRPQLRPRECLESFLASYDLNLWVGSTQRF